MFVPLSSAFISVEPSSFLQKKKKKYPEGQGRGEAPQGNHISLVSVVALRWRQNGQPGS